MTISLYYLPFNLIWGDGLSKAEKRQIRLKILNLQDEHCKGCKTVPKSIGNNYALARWCSKNCEVGKNLKSLGESLLEGRTQNMAEQKNWDQICATAEKLRVSDEKKWTWGNIAAEFGVTEGNLYYHVSKRREANGTPNKRVGVSKNPQKAKPSPVTQNVEKSKSEPSELKSIATEHIEKAEALDAFWKGRLNEILDEKDAMQKELKEISKLYEELKGIKEKLAQDLIAEKKLRFETEDALKLSQEQLQSRDEDYNTLLNEFNAITEKNHELEHDLRKMHIRVGAAEETAAKEREHRLELQGRSQALGIALKAVL
ncbi:zinc-finger domain-containing protein [Bacillus albus]|nr:zinc-finger domain-containing protein [Bacillus albus]RXJ30043.1 zinc-finger domain-containing protein [Bacillus albus]RXJ31635.1 zinc-finger domain-containing protein [Bacillus albus]RXJ42859.1 zinc-finger domain-containing protein [Bacillus albus]RXJ59787.1 zinc-finger domain-containing protein [Bacillus albus]